MKKMHIIFNDEDYYNELIGDIGEWCGVHGIPEDKIIVGVKEEDFDDVDYYVITVNETLFGYLMLREFNIFDKYGVEGWNRHIESNYNCETA